MKIHTLKIKISNKWVGDGSPVFIMAEAGINHNGSLKIAKKMISEAKRAGADGIKFQTFKADDLAVPTSKFFKIFKRLEFSNTNFEELADYAKSNSIIFCSTPFSLSAIDLLSKLRVPAIKIASGDLTDIPLIKYAAAKKKPMIISTGMANMIEVKNAVRAVESTGNKKIIILHCVSAYPTPPSEVNLNVIYELKKQFHYPIGFSDNGPGLIVPLTSIAVGAKFLEKHFTLNRKMKGSDQSLSADPIQLKQIVTKTREIEGLLGDGKKRCQPSELENKLHVRRSITAAKTIEKGSRITNEMVTTKRPATGIEPINLSKVIGKKAKKKIRIHESLKWQHLLN